MHNMYLASARAVKLGRTIDKDFHFGCMIAATISYPGTCDPKDVFLNRQRLEQMLFYSGDVQCFGEYPTFSTRLWKDLDLHFSEEDLTEDEGQSNNDKDDIPFGGNEIRYCHKDPGRKRQCGHLSKDIFELRQNISEKDSNNNHDQYA